MPAKKMNIYKCIVSCGLSVVIGVVSGFYFSERVFKTYSEFNLKELAELSDSAYIAYLEGEPLAAKGVMQNYLKVINSSLQSIATQKRALQLDKTLTLGRLALIAEKTNNAAETEKYFQMAIESCKDSKGERCSEADIRERVKRLDEIKR
jgi:hypothetical protein